MQVTATPLKIKVSVPEHIAVDLLKKKQNLYISLCAGCGTPLKFDKLMEDPLCELCEALKIQQEKTGEF